jgi:hypothetical protein
MIDRDVPDRDQDFNTVIQSLRRLDNIIKAMIGDEFNRMPDDILIGTLY